MKRFVKFAIHEYMDMKPDTSVRMLSGETEDDIKKVALMYAEGMNQMYSGGTTSYEGIMSAEAARSYLLDLIADTRWGECTKEDEDNFWKLYEECYGPVE